jgi:hypothetical protein
MRRAMDDRRHGEVSFACWRWLTRAEDRKPEVQVLVVFTEDDLCRCRTVNLEKGDAAPFVPCAERLELLGGLETRASYECVSDSHEAADPSDRVGVREIHRRVHARRFATLEGATRALRRAIGSTWMRSSREYACGWWRLTFGMSGGRRQVQPAGGRPLDERGSRHCV